MRPSTSRISPVRNSPGQTRDSSVPASISVNGTPPAVAARLRQDTPKAGGKLTAIVVDDPNSLDIHVTQLAQVRKAYGIQVSREKLAGSQVGYLIHHSSFVYLVDRSGSLRAMIPFGVTADDIVHDVKALLGP